MGKESLKCDPNLGFDPTTDTHEMVEMVRLEMKVARGKLTECAGLLRAVGEKISRKRTRAICDFEQAIGGMRQIRLLRLLALRSDFLELMSIPKAKLYRLKGAAKREQERKASIG